MKSFLAISILLASSAVFAEPVCGTNNNRGREITTQVCVDRGSDGKLLVRLQTQSGPVLLKEVAILSKKEGGYENSTYIDYEMAQVDAQGNVFGRGRFRIHVGFEENGVPFTLNNTADRNKKLIGSISGVYLK